MTVDLVLSLAQRDAIVNAVAAIRRQLKDVGDAATTPAVMAIGTNLTIIQTSLTNLPLALKLSHHRNLNRPPYRTADVNLVPFEEPLRSARSAKSSR